MGGRKHIHFQPDGLQISIPGPQQASHVLRLAVQAFQIVMSLLQHERGRCIVFLGFFCSCGEFFQGVQPDSHFHTLQLILQLQIFFCFFRLGLQGLQLQLQFRDLVADTQQVVLGVLQFPLCFFLAVAVFGDTCRFLKDLPAVCAFQRKNLIDPALTDIGIAFPTQTGIHKQLMDVPKPGRLLVDIELTVTAAVEPAGHHHFVCVIGQRTVRVVQRQRSFGKAYRRTLLGSAEDHVLHFGAAQGLGALLTHDPQDGIGNI